MSRPLTLRRTFAFLLFGGVAVFAFQAGCGDTTGSTFTPPSGEDGSSPDPIPPGFDKGDGAAPKPPDVDATGILDVTPATSTINVTIANGVINAPPQTFTALYNGQPVTGVTWLFDRGELGEISSTGVFKASGTNVGEGIVTARYGAREGTAKVKITINSTQNGAPAGADAGGGGFGGLGGVGGEPLGPAVSASVATKLKTQSNIPTTAEELGFLYPYEATVWPRGLLPPLLMWQTTHEASAVYVKLSQGNYTFEGTYAVSQHPAGSAARKRVRLEESAWRTATQGNTGDDLKLEVKIYTPSEDKVYGPITRTWKVAPGVLRGTVYYNSYDSYVTTGGGSETGGIIKIKPRSPDPELAVASMAGKCHACHVLSADGSTLWAQDANGPKDTDTEYANGASYDLTNNGARKEYTALGASGNIEHDHKFTWAAPYPDGSFALASYGYAREAFVRGGRSKLYNRAAGAEVLATNLDQVTSAVTPSFSPDGRKVAFNFWVGPGVNGVAQGDGHSLAVFDFTCGASPGSITCGAGVTPSFSGLRELYRDNGRWPGWPSFLPDAKAVIFHNTLQAADVGGSGTLCRADIVNPPPSIKNCQLTTFRPATTSTGATSELWIATDGSPANARRLDALNGIGPDGVTPYLPKSALHQNDPVLNYMPTVNPVASGGFYWVVFTSRRQYGNLLTADPYTGSVTESGGERPTKKLWVAAIDINNPTAGADPSHPAFYLPGQELSAGNTRGYWVVDPCKPNGQSCETGDECCNGFCRKDAQTGALVCQDKPPGGQCVQEFEKCTVDGDCCDPNFKCIAGKCTRPDPNVK